MDFLSTLFLFCLFFGIAFIVISFVAGHALAGHGVHAHGSHHGVASNGAAPFGGASHGAAHHAVAHHGHLSHATPIHGAAHSTEAGHPANGLLAWFGGLNLSPTSIAMFLAWFGGAGYSVYALLGLGAVAGISAALLAGLIGAALVTLFLVRILIPGQSVMDDSQVVGPGTVARVSREIRAEGIGEIVYTLGETRHSEGARALDGIAIARGTEVVIAHLERGIAYVQPWSTYVDSWGQKENER